MVFAEAFFRLHPRFVFGAALGAALVLTAPASAGQLVLNNTSAAPITCTVDGWTLASGGSFDWYIQVMPNVPFNVGQNTTRQGPQIINWASCNDLTTRSMTITPAGPSHTLILNGQQTRVLNASLYAYLPTLPVDPNQPNSQFESLVTYVETTYQAQNPQVLLNGVLDQNVNIYDFNALPGLLSSSGFDVMELDMLYLGYLQSNDLINPAQISGDAPLAVGIAGASINGTLYGIPSWLCMDFLFSGDSSLSNQKTFTQLKAYFTGMPTTKAELAADFNGTWRIPAMYINGYVQQYGIAKIADALTMPPDDSIIKNLIGMTNACAFANANKCIDTTFHAGNGLSEKAFASGQSSNDMGFSEQSFFINLYGPVSPLYIIAPPWGQTVQPLLYEDAFVTSKATCAPATPCASDAKAFTTLMTGLSMKNYIVQSKDLPANNPWRTLLVANASFWQQPIITQHPLYKQYATALPSAQPFPNAFTAAIQTAMATQICAALKTQQAPVPYTCKSSLAGITRQADAQNGSLRPSTRNGL